MNQESEERSWGRRLADGVAGRLDFDYSRVMGHSFGELYTYGIVQAILGANIDPSREIVQTGYAHPALRGTARRRGRRCELDFFIERRSNPEAGSLALEVKWARQDDSGRLTGHASGQNVLLDLCRLSIVAEASGGRTECLMMVAGRVAAVNALLDDRYLKLREGRLLRMPSSTRLDRPLKRDFSALVRDGLVMPKGLSKLPKVPKVISTQGVPARSIEPRRWQVLVWKILP